MFIRRRGCKQYYVTYKKVHKGRLHAGPHLPNVRTSPAPAPSLMHETITSYMDLHKALAVIDFTPGTNNCSTSPVAQFVFCASQDAPWIFYCCSTAGNYPNLQAWSQRCACCGPVCNIGLNGISSWRSPRQLSCLQAGGMSTLLFQAATSGAFISLFNLCIALGDGHTYFNHCEYEVLSKRPFTAHCAPGAHNDQPL